VSLVLVVNFLLLTIICSYDTLQDRIKDTFANSSNAAIIKAVSSIFRSAQDPLRLGAIRAASMSTLNTVEEVTPAQSLRHKLEELGMDGLTTSFQFLPPNRSHWSKIAAWISDLVQKIVGLD
jgi:neurofibromin 1